jgi:GGDEF domain-containing protein
MNCRRFFRLLCGTPAVPHFQETKAEPLPVPAAGTGAQSGCGAHQESEEAHPAHTCVDQPTLPCPACLKWTGDGFATVRNNSQCFPGMTDKLVVDMQYDTSGYAVMVRVRLVDRWAWTTWMRYDTYEQAAAQQREGDKIVPFGSAEWTALRQSAEPALPPNATAQRKSQHRCQGETLLEFMLRFLSGYGFDQRPPHSSNATRDLEPAGFNDLENQASYISGTAFDEQTVGIETPIEIVHRVLSSLDEREIIREFERMHTNRVRVGLEARFHGVPKQKARKRLLVPQDAVKPSNSERRVDLEKRQRTAEMSPAEMQRELLTSEVTGLPNRRAFAEAGAASAVAMSNVDGLKALNDKCGYDAGDALLKAKAVALREAQLEAYHDKGDEFLYRGNSLEELQADLERARGILRNHTIVVERADGRTLQFTGADFSYGIGQDIGHAEIRLKSHKAERKARGELERGQLRGIIKRQKPESAVPH